MSELYQTKEWKSLPVAERAYLLPAMEDVRPGAMLNIKDDSKISPLEKCLAEKGMKASKEGNLWFVSKDFSILNNTVFIRSLYKEAEKTFTPEEKRGKIFAKFKNLYHKVLGEFFAYPNCCIDKFIETYSKELFPCQKWYKTAGKALKKGKYNSLLDYTFHAPCSLECKDTLKLAEETKKCLTTHDFEAAEHLKTLNRKLMEYATKRI